VRAVDRALERSVVLERFHAEPGKITAARLRAAAKAGGSTLQRVLSLTATQVVYEAPAGDPVGTKALTPRQVVKLLDDVGRALESLHAQGVAHGAVSAERILWDERATLALAGMPDSEATPADDAKAALAVAKAALGEHPLPSRPVARGADLVELARELRRAIFRPS
jgi:tRNA A-37 threonylcarbamoyl transferase component Bud32